MKNKYIICIAILTLLLASSVARAQDAVYVRIGELTSESEGQALVALDVKNTMSQSLYAARAWVFLMDDDGKVVGNEAQWIISAETSPPLETGKQRTYNLVLPSSGKAATAKVIFSRIVMEDGTTPDPRTIVEEFPEESQQEAHTE